MEQKETTDEMLPVVATPHIPTAAESLQLAVVAEKLHGSGLFPALRNPAGAFAVVQFGRELGVGPMTALQNMSIISGKPAVMGQLMLSLAMRKGVTYKVTTESTTKSDVLFRRGSAQYAASFTMDEAKQAGLVKPGSGWAKYPKDMLFWRAVARGLRRIAPDAVTGLYTIDEISDGAFTDIAELPAVEPISDPPPVDRGEPAKRAQTASQAPQERSEQPAKTYDNSQQPNNVSDQEWQAGIKRRISSKYDNGKCCFCGEKHIEAGQDIVTAGDGWGDATCFWLQHDGEDQQTEEPQPDN